MNEIEYPILIKSQAHRNQFVTMLLGVFMTLSCIISSFYLWQQYQIYIIIFSLISVLIISLSILKYFEPQYCLGLTDEKLFYYHRKGKWSISWTNIQLIHHPKGNDDLAERNINFIGIKLRSYDCDTNIITPRLANHLLHEQNHLLILAFQNNEIEVEQTQINFSPFKTLQGQEITGPIAAWLHQMQILRKIYGYDLYIPINCFSSPTEQIISLFKKNQQRAISSIDNIKLYQNNINE
ncbi:hypothetical protein CJF42_09150 [Pseudoalteromonas sp. NBT06-2]|uniref:DUF2982 domain-containing protein n=1 Tax=Pseudoalteromonas sp. NBT06-2 TaxID=2025950 RepID=UPI000BA7A1BC|nr:DUF2982 domain-containing protein [Pseudoalteromonas sp. NBT06-2]PAJ74717.1 hypothetical protein CJF42_09150 [Pseudoalteromonas sp. NBT06-2]